MNLLSGLAIFLLGASAGSILRYFQDRKLLQMYRKKPIAPFRLYLN